MTIGPAWAWSGGLSFPYLGRGGEPEAPVVPRQLPFRQDPMARRDRLFVCQSCGAVHPRWAGRCDFCGGWNSIVEETPASAVPGAAGAVANAKRGRRLEVVELDLAHRTAAAAAHRDRGA